MQPAQFAAQRTQPQRRMVRTGLQQQQRLPILHKQLRVALEEARRAGLLAGKDQRAAHGRLARRFMWASTDSLTKRSAARSV